MTRRLSILAATIVSLLGGLTEFSKAEILVYRARLTSVTREGDSGLKVGTPMPTGMARLVALDLNTDFWEEAAESALSIEVYENRGKKSYSTHFAESRSYTKFGFYARGAKFYLFGGNFKESGSMDHGSVQAQGRVRTNVVIGGRRGKASVPSDTVVTQVRGDAEIFKKFVFSLKYDQALTVAVNNYLSIDGFQSAEGAGYSADIRRGMAWLADTYLPQNFKDVWPFDD
jgi:hypothetical protein